MLTRRQFLTGLLTLSAPNARRKVRPVRLPVELYRNGKRQRTRFLEDPRPGYVEAFNEVHRDDNRYAVMVND